MMLAYAMRFLNNARPRMKIESAQSTKNTFFDTSVGHSEQEGSRKTVGEEHLPSTGAQEPWPKEVRQGMQHPRGNMSNPQMRRRKSRKVDRLNLFKDSPRKKETNDIARKETACYQPSQAKNSAHPTNIQQWRTF
jgi:hypothetical protein